MVRQSLRCHTLDLPSLQSKRNHPPYDSLDSQCSRLRHAAFVQDYDTIQLHLINTYGLLILVGRQALPY
jgi:hypothetical protein